MARIIQQSLIIILAAIAIPAFAGEFEVGVAAINQNSIITQKENDNELVPVFNYQGEKFSFLYGVIGYQLYASEDWMIQAIAEQRSMGYRPSDSRFLSGMAQREDAFDAGFQVARGGSWGIFQFKLLTDVSDTYEGFENTLAYSYPWQDGRWMFEPTLGIKFQSSELVDYFYGVKATESTSFRPAYDAEGSLSAFAKFSLAYLMHQKLKVLGGMEYNVPGDDVTDSPIVDEDYQLTTFAALMYSF